jgi:hypothetical protein
VRKSRYWTLKAGFRSGQTRTLYFLKHSSRFVGADFKLITTHPCASNSHPLTLTANRPTGRHLDGAGVLRSARSVSDGRAQRTQPPRSLYSLRAPASKKTGGVIRRLSGRHLSDLQVIHS